ncbi:MAG: sugar transferase [Saprospiraceae bacterium]|nr:sugar transferase [bacterium]MDC3210483.1 sugar transferase [Saprospiraceae bacterium]MDC3219593.1 sugar transferase [Saprospiraceae bacterium]MDG1432436.1 sugar transferase [Saprospiraceae bacterium]MDG2418186.1 sugar transferase [Saprospiraceae bacterium]
MKRIFDILFSTSILLLLFPILFIIGVSIIMESRGGMFFSQKRVGKNEQPFQILKFRTMFVDSEKKSQITVGDRDPRITRVGFFLRNYKLDELPQFWNVLIGEMSIVGPRPEVPYYVNFYDKKQRQVFEVKPGITDYASLKYFDENLLLGKSDDPEKTYINEIMPQKLILNLEYAQSNSFLIDLIIIGKTALRILKK